MDEKKENKNLRSDAVHPAVLKVTGDETRRWCAAIWSVSPGEQRLVVGIHGLVNGTLVAHWMQPPAQVKSDRELFHSFDLLFYESVTDEFASFLGSEGWEKVQVMAMASDEYEQFEILAEEAKKQGRSVASRPSELWRIPIERATPGQPVDFVAIETAVAKEMSGQVWGQSPGQFSKIYCDELRRETGIEVTPDFEGLQTFEQVVAGAKVEGIGWLGSMTYQAMCDFLGVIMQSATALDVQWGMCPVDENTGLAPAPVLRIRGRATPWTTVGVGRDVLGAICVPWGREGDSGERLVSLIGSYERDCLGRQ